MGVTAAGDFEQRFGDHEIAERQVRAERLISAKRREVARLRQDMRMQEVQMQTLIARDLDCTDAAMELLGMRRRLAQLIVERDTLMDALMYRLKDQLPESKFGNGGVGV